MQISSPFGYEEVVPFLKNQKVRLLAEGDLPPFALRGNAVPVSYTEFQAAARHYPIVFASGSADKTFSAVAVLGITPGENLFVSGGKWAAESYVPAYVRRYPFCMAKVSVNQVAQQNRLICVEKARLDETHGEAMFDADGKPLARWGAIERLLSEYEADLQRTVEMCSIFADYGLLEPFSMQATLPAGASPLQLTGMHRVAEKRLQDLNAAQLRTLLGKGLMARLYLHLASLENFGRLLERKSARTVPA